MKIVVVGAGAVGVVYGRHLQRGGAHLTFLVRPKYADDVRKGIRTYDLTQMKRHPDGELLVPDDVVTDVEQLRGRPLDQAWLCVPTTGVDEGMLRALADATGDATVVDLSADAERRARKCIRADRVVEGSIPLIAYQTPLPGVPEESGRAPGIAYWLPPLLKSPFSGARAKSVVDALKAGRMGARVVADAGRERALASSLFNTVIAHLELADWRLAAVRRRLDDAPREALAIAVREAGGRAGAAAIAAQPLVLRMVAGLAPAVAPLPMEPYLKFHFTKVGAQTRRSLGLLVEKADRHGLPAPALRRLHTELSALAPSNGRAVNGM